MTLTKTAKIVKRKNEWCVIGHKRDKSGKYRNFGCYESKEKAEERLGQIQMFKRKKAAILEGIIEVSDELTSHGLYHLTDVLTSCLEAIATERVEGNTILKMGKIINALQKKGELECAEKIDAMLPDVLCFENCDCIDEVKRPRMTADRVYKIASGLREKYQNGLIDEKSFEFNKMAEFEQMLKTSFLLPAPKEINLPTDVSNWWEHFTRSAK